MTPNRAIVAVALIAVLLSGARAAPGSGASSDRAAPMLASSTDAASDASRRAPSMERRVRPTDVNPAATQTPHSSVVINPDPAVPDKHRLFLFIGGTTSAPRDYVDILRTGASRGYHAINLAYPDDLAVGVACADDQDPACTAKFRAEVLTGLNFSKYVDVDVPNSVIGRLSDLLAYLDRTYPAEHWGQFLSDGRIDWAHVTAAGHSQGAGHAAYLAKLFKLDRMVMFSGVADLSPSHTTAAWLSWPNATPASRQYGFGHLLDPVVWFVIQRNSWHALGLDAFGPVAVVDSGAPPYGGSHQLATSAQPSQRGAQLGASVYHSVPVADRVTPLTASGEPALAPVWVYMAFP